MQQDKRKRNITLLTGHGPIYLISNNLPKQLNKFNSRHNNYTALHLGNKWKNVCPCFSQHILHAQNWTLQTHVRLTFNQEYIFPVIKIKFACKSFTFKFCC